MAYNSTTWSPDTLSKASETSSATLNNATLSGTLTVSGATQLNSTLSVGVNDTGHDVKFFGATSGKYLLWDASDDDLILAGDNVTLNASGDMAISGDLTVTGNNISGSSGGVITFSGNNVQLADNLYLNTNASQLFMGASSDVTLYHTTAGFLTIRGYTSVTNAILSQLRLRHETSGTPSVGMGTSIQYEVETSSGNVEAGMKLGVQCLDVSSGAEDFDFVVQLMENGNTVAERMRLTSSGNLSTSGVVTSGVTYTHYFGISEISPSTAGYHYTLNNGMMNASPTGGDSSSLGNGTDPATTLDWSGITSTEQEDYIAAMWYVPIDCTITEVKALATTDGSTSNTLRFHVMQYDLDTSSNPGDLSSGVVKASSADISSLTKDTMKVSPAFTLDSADLTAGKIVIVTMEADDATDKISAQVYINYKAR